MWPAISRLARLVWRTKRCTSMVGSTRSGAPIRAMAVQRQSIQITTPMSEISATMSRPTPVMMTLATLRIAPVSPPIRSISAPGGLAEWNSVSSVMRCLSSAVCSSKMIMDEVRVIRMRCSTLVPARTRKMTKITVPTHISASGSPPMKTRSNIGFIM